MRRSALILNVLLIIVVLLSANAAHALLRPDCNQKGKWGYVDENGQIVVKHQFTGASEFNDGVAHVLSGKKYGVIDSEGKYIIKPDYDIISPFNEYGLAQVTKDNKSGFIDKTGKIVIPIKYAFVGDFNADGIVWVNKDGKIKKGDTTVSGGEFTLFRSDGTNFLDDSYRTIGYFVPFTHSFTTAQKEKMTLTERRLTEGDDYVYWSKVKYSFKPGRKILFNKSGLWASYREDGYYNGVYNRDGSEIIPSGTYYVAQYPNEGTAIVCTTENAYNFLDIASGSLALSNPLEHSWGFKDGHAVGKYRGLWYIYDKKGHQCSQGYTYIYPVNGGVHVVRNGNDKYGLITSSGQEILPISNYSVYPFIGGASMVKTTSKSKVGYIGANGQWIIPPTYDNGHTFDNGRVLVSLNGKWGCVDMKAKVLIPFEFYSIMIKSDKAGLRYWVRREKGANFELFDISEGASVLEPKYADAYPFDQLCHGLAKVNPSNMKNTWGAIDRQGNVVIPFEYTADLATKAILEYKNTGRGEWSDYRNFMFRLRHNNHPVDLGSTVSEENWDY